MAWGSDAMAAVLAELELPYIALTPGSSYRGLHDSLVNYLGNERPAVILCLHEEHAVAIAHGYAKVLERPMAVALHSNVGLMHATMALYNAYCDRVPMLVLGATGPVDASKRRPWIDWLHTSTDQGALVRSYTKWDDQPASVAAALESLLRAALLTRAYPSAPTYVCLDVSDQESALEAPLELPDPHRHRAPDPPVPDPALVEKALTLLEAASSPLVLVGRVGRSMRTWEERICLVERLGACVLTDLKVGAAFPSDHALHPTPPSTFLSPAGQALVRRADVILSLDWIDLAGTLRQAFGAGAVRAQVISCSVEFTMANGWTKDHFALAPIDVSIPAHPDLLVRALLEHRAATAAASRANWPGPSTTAEQSGPRPSDGSVDLKGLADELALALEGRSACLVRLPLGWDGADLHVTHPLDYLGNDGGGGIGSGPGMVVGAALALEGSGRLAIGVLGDGDYLMGLSALWSAAHYGVPLLIVVANNQSFFNDEIHQERIAITRGRPVENRWVGQRISDPTPDLAALARSLGLCGHGPVAERGELRYTLAEAVAEVEAGKCSVIDVRVTTRGYPRGPTA